MNNLKQFLIWWVTDSTQSIRKYWPEIRHKTLVLVEVISMLMLVAILLLTIIAVLSAYFDKDGAWFNYSTLMVWAVTPTLYLLSRYFHSKWQDWQQDQARLLETLSRKN